MKQKVLFFDIDGTLVDTCKNIPSMSQGVKEELKRLQALGHKIFISSGRPKPMVDQQFLDLGFDGYILMNGGYIEIEGQSIYEDRIDYHLISKTIELLEKLGCEYMIETAQHVYLDKRFNGLYNFFDHFRKADHFIREFDREAVLKKAIKVEMNVLNKDKERIEASIKKNFGYTIEFDQHGTDNSFEVYSSTISKATGIEKVLAYFGLNQEDSYAFGDGMNDIEMLKYCGVGVAMGNAVQELKDIADIVCLPIEEDGLEKILKELF